MKKTGIMTAILSAAIMLVACEETPTEDVSDTTYSYLVGAYTNADDQGIQLLTFKPDSMSMSAKIIAPAQNNPSFVVANKAKNLVFAVDESEGEQGGKVKSFRFDEASGSMELLSVLDSYGNHPCYLGLDPSENFLIVGNYSGGNLSVYKIEDGNLIHVQTIAHEGGSINESRQSSSHVHSVVFHPNGKQLLVGDLGTDKIHIYDFDASQELPLSEANPADFSVTPGVGPRHLVVHPDGKQIFLVHEMSAELGVYHYDSGVISPSQVLPLTDPDFTGRVGAAEVRISHDGNFVYASNRGEANEISGFKIEADGTLSFVQRISTGGQTPRNFILTPDDQFLIVGNQDSNDIRVFKRNVQTGELTATDVMVSMYKPVYFYPLQ